MIAPSSNDLRLTVIALPEGDFSKERSYGALRVFAQYFVVHQRLVYHNPAAFSSTRTGDVRVLPAAGQINCEEQPGHPYRLFLSAKRLDAMMEGIL
jgi:hypothetical protein